ncbi:isopentenyl diphosphate isomerase/L-lactate dehydrogenase-like FMN-dependent dehydrogenase [Hoeflea halophila]|uniref:Isopentenyl diphosphate isomerase/L-lactate dehydrogenase-like FMN-dependent dehydrogenase n=1 Tax=Hoeflea halophila TaxID=714899 RepID=A0A286I839_9HYPH|nr:alpha-hydroxy-acid oxidizing protein [Hoeflea halophila]SOE16298.1 isopentenyl diphosphate isomerase/L-lactate dehydrogenase-like FMN-dependent dehydrogenase [Hoeflea halophila]
MSVPPSALTHQRSIYLAGVSGERPRVPFHITSLEQEAEKRLSAQAYAYIAGGAGAGQTVAANRADFNRWRILPRMLNDVSEVDLSTRLIGLDLPAPLLLAPLGVMELAHPQSDLAIGRAAAKHGVPLIISNQASRPMEEVAKAMGDAPRWFQLYWSREEELVKSFVSRAENCGCSAIVVTLDTKMLGWRVNDLDLAYLPFLRGKGIAQYTSDPVFQRLVDEMPEDPQAPKPRINLKSLATLWQMLNAHPGSPLDNLRSGRAQKAVKLFTGIYTNPTLNWEHIARLRSYTRLPIILKGILHPEEAVRAVDEGVDGLIVSNHGGRQVDGAVSTISALPAISSAVKGRIPLILDSGVRSGADMIKAMALGASAVAIGRPYAYGLALAGEDGVSEVIRGLLSDFELNLRLAGGTRPSDIDASWLVRAP